MSLRDYLESFHNALSKIEDYGFADSTDINVEIRELEENNIRISCRIFVRLQGVMTSA